ncbi:MAG: hypothetical protein JNM34_13360 [Chthonomonadaceae bacterium]|nr:hypothetical protein [Chthonomonadaceae bacterium]
MTVILTAKNLDFCGLSRQTVDNDTFFQVQIGRLRTTKYGMSLTVNQRVVGSSPTAAATFLGSKSPFQGAFLFDASLAIANVGGS